MKKKHILIAAGGTGGHIFPALSVAKELQKHNIKISWFGSKAGMEQTIITKYKYELYSVNIVGLRGKKFTNLLKSPFLILLSLLQTIIIFIKLKPSAVLGMGGFVSGIAGLVAKLFNIPIIIHEQNAIAGTSNKILAKFANTIYQAFDNSFSKNTNAITVGNPILFTKQDKTPISKPLNLLVIGGSLGAKAINNIIPQLQTPINIIHQTGRLDYHRVLKKYENTANIQNTQITKFIDDMASAYAWADIVISRSGAMTVSEIMLSGSASILVPFLYAIDDHQTHNAKILLDNNAAMLISEVDMKVDKLDNILTNITNKEIQTMGKNAEQLITKNSAKIIANKLKSL